MTLLTRASFYWEWGMFIQKTKCIAILTLPNTKFLSPDGAKLTMMPKLIIWRKVKVIHDVPTTYLKSWLKNRSSYCCIKQIGPSLHGEMNFGAPSNLRNDCSAVVLHHINCYIDVRRQIWPVADWNRLSTYHRLLDGYWMVTGRLLVVVIWEVWYPSFWHLVMIGDWWWFWVTAPISGYLSITICHWTAVYSVALRVPAVTSLLLPFSVTPKTVTAI
jgi:hypothetical protein